MNKPFKYCKTMMFRCKANSNINCGDMVQFSEPKWIQRLKDRFGIVKKVESIPEPSDLQADMITSLQSSVDAEDAAWALISGIRWKEPNTDYINDLARVKR